MSELLITNCELCFEKFKNNGADNYGVGYYVKRLGCKMICGSCCIDDCTTLQTIGSGDKK